MSLENYDTFTKLAFQNNSKHLQTLYRFSVQATQSYLYCSEYYMVQIISVSTSTTKIFTHNTTQFQYHRYSTRVFNFIHTIHTTLTRSCKHQQDVYIQFYNCQYQRLYYYSNQYTILIYNTCAFIILYNFTQGSYSQKYSCNTLFCNTIVQNLVIQIFYSIQCSVYILFIVQQYESQRERIQWYRIWKNSTTRCNNSFRRSQRIISPYTMDIVYQQRILRFCVNLYSMQITKVFNTFHYLCMLKILYILQQLSQILYISYYSCSIAVCICYFVPFHHMLVLGFRIRKNSTTQCDNSKVESSCHTKLGSTQFGQSFSGWSELSRTMVKPIFKQQVIQFRQVVLPKD
eukprot:TRINITY_DN28829_c0_g1_i1.p2 TRINITY_DN28829_c0_g1~~TRINITY_DN28829_c0_g1_i1.p2  ORF type:complete len:345 (-),score=-46.53 TRINITY_DN28829_c0_g1_i1:467-1501(-)